MNKPAVPPIQETEIPFGSCLKPLFLHGSGLSSAIQASRAQAAELERLRLQVARNAPRVAALGAWSDSIPPMSLMQRVPVSLDDHDVSGFDAGIACALDLIPRDRQQLAAKLHAAYTPGAVEQVRSEMTTDMDPDSETCWWLAGCSVCMEGEVDGRTFLRQVESFVDLAGDPERRLIAAHRTARDMVTSYRIQDGFAHAIRDGGMQGAYLAGHDLAVQFSDAYGIFFVGTFRRTLSIPADFGWESTDRSGPVHGSKQFVKAASAAELQRVLAAASPAD